MLENILIFIIFLCPLIFFHELGHFLFAKFFGVKVEVFSIGFGPKIFKKSYGETEYAISAIPFGGYVKMFGDDPRAKDEISEEDKKKSFLHKGKMARFFIVFGGPLANFIFAYVIFFFLFLGGEKVPEVKFGHVSTGSVLHSKGIQAGDILKAVNGKVVLGPAEIDVGPSTEVRDISVLRDGELKTVPLLINGAVFIKELMSHPPLLRRPIVVNGKGDRFAISQKEVGAKDWTVATSLEVLSNRKGDRTIYIFKMRGSGAFSIEAKSLRSISLNTKNKDEFFKTLRKNDLYPLDLSIKNVSIAGPASKAGVVSGDIVISLDKVDIFGFEELRETLQKSTGVSVELGLIRSGEVHNFTITPDIQMNDNISRKLIGVTSSLEYLKPTLIETKSKGFFGSLYLALPRTWNTIGVVFSGFKRLVTSTTAFKHVGGPVAIAKVAGDSFRTGLSYFFQIMALISINLGVLNLLPIPVLDGGHIFFLGIELLNNGPLSRKKLEIAQQVGLSLLLLLMVVAIFNDVSGLF